jgi:hypothetical protein
LLERRVGGHCGRIDRTRSGTMVQRSVSPRVERRQADSGAASGSRQGWEGLLWSGPGARRTMSPIPQEMWIKAGAAFGVSCSGPARRRPGQVDHYCRPSREKGDDREHQDLRQRHLLVSSEKTATAPARRAVTVLRPLRKLSAPRRPFHQSFRGDFRWTAPESGNGAILRPIASGISGDPELRIADCKASEVFRIWNSQSVICNL